MKKILALLLAVAIAVTPMDICAKEQGIKQTNGIKAPTLQAGTILIKSNRLEAPLLNAAYAMTVSEAAQAARSAIYDHLSKVDVYCKSTKSKPEAVYEELREKIFEPNSNSGQGDYMFWDMDYIQVNYSSSKSGSKYYYHFVLYPAYRTTIEQRDFVDQKVDEIINSFNFTPSTNTYTKVKTVYDYVCENVTYSEDTSDDIVYSAYSALNDGNAVCQGYAQLLYKFYTKLGIPCRVVPGYGYEIKTVSHGWNIVKLGSYYYNVDATWDAAYRQNGRKYAYFLKGDNFINHERWADYSTSEFYLKYPMAANAYGAGTPALSVKSQKARFQTKKVKIKSASRKKVKLTKVAGASGYQIKYSTSSKFSKCKTKVTKKTTYKLKKLKAKKNYYVKYRAYKNIAGSKVYTKYSAKKKIKKKK